MRVASSLNNVRTHAPQTAANSRPWRENTSHALVFEADFFLSATKGVLSSSGLPDEFRRFPSATYMAEVYVSGSAGRTRR